MQSTQSSLDLQTYLCSENIFAPAKPAECRDENTASGDRIPGRSGLDGNVNNYLDYMEGELMVISCVSGGDRTSYSLFP